jgi:hypothetical protein
MFQRKHPGQSQMLNAIAARAPKKAKWTPEEDEQLRMAIRICGTDSWNRVADRVQTRTGKQCRERWIAQLAPTVSKEGWLPEEDVLLMQAHAQAGNRWTTIALSLPGRSSLSIKNRWHWLMRHHAIVTPSRMDLPDVVERSKPCRAVFDPLPIDDRPFGAAFQEFKTRMFLGTDLRSRI